MTRLDTEGWPVEDDHIKPELQVIKAVHDFRLKNGVSQGELAEKVGTKQTAISRLESGRSNPSIKFLKKLAEALGMRLEIKFVKEV